MTEHLYVGVTTVVLPVIAAAMGLSMAQAGSLVGFLYSGNMGLSFLAPLLAGLVADAYGLPTAVTFIGIFPLLACVVPLAVLKKKGGSACLEYSPVAEAEVAVVTDHDVV